MSFVEAVQSVTHNMNCASRKRWSLDPLYEPPRINSCNCDRDVRIAKGIDAVVEAAGEDGTCGEVFTISELIVIFTEAAK